MGIPIMNQFQEIKSMERRVIETMKEKGMERRMIMEMMRTVRGWF
jgi:hypothetical protein